MIAWDVVVDLKTPLHIGSGEGFGNYIDMTVMKNANGFPFIPASSFKGRIRANFMKLGNIMKDNKGLELSKDLCITIRDESNDKETLNKICMYDRKNINEYCPLCKIFGTKYYQPNVRFTDLRIVNTNRHDCLDYRTSNQINRKTKISKDKSLYNYEFTHKETQFVGKIYFDNNGLDKLEELLLKAAIAMTTHLGGQKSRGLGRCEISITNIIKMEGGFYEECKD